MAAALGVAALWLLFGATHVGMSSRAWRPRLVASLGERGFQAVYSLVALAVFVPLVWLYFANKHAGPLLWAIPLHGLGRWLLYGLMGVAFVLVAGGIVTPSPASLQPGRPEPRGVLRLTRHPMFMGIGLFGVLHLVPNGFASDVAFFGGLLAFALVGCWHQDRRKLAESEAYRRFHAATPFLPFTGRETLAGLRELSPVAIAIGIALTAGLRWFHGSLFGP
jgi:uncharacterized membrane protein